MADSTPSTDAEGYTAEEREVVDAVTAYTDALIGYQKGDRDIDLTTVATTEPTRLTYELARQGESWVVSDATPEGSGC